MALGSDSYRKIRLIQGNPERAILSQCWRNPVRCRDYLEREYWLHGVAGKSLTLLGGDDIVRHPEESGSKESNSKDEYQALVHKDLVDEYKALADKSIAYAGKYLNIQCPHIGESDSGLNWAATH